jgi:DNA-binding response OmpR family regulator
MNPANTESSVSALLVGNYDTDGLMVRQVFQQAGWRLFEAQNRRRALDCLTRNSVHVVITEHDLPRWDWRAVLQDLRNMDRPPQLILASRKADDRLWAEALNVGAYDVLRRPMDRDEVERVIASARRHFDPAHLRSEKLSATFSGVA